MLLSIHLLQFKHDRINNPLSTLEKYIGSYRNYLWDHCQYLHYCQFVSVLILKLIVVSRNLPPQKNIPTILTYSCKSPNAAEWIQMLTSRVTFGDNTIIPAAASAVYTWFFVDYTSFSINYLYHIIVISR